MNLTSIGIAGAGRMGQAVARTIAAHDELKLAGIWLRDPQKARALDMPGDALLSADLDAIVAAADVLVDFSLPDATATVAAAVCRLKKPWVCGVSGFAAAQMAHLDTAAAEVAVVYDRNFSLGVSVLQTLVGRAAASLGMDFEVLVREAHHVNKLDAPSGTALKLGEAVAAARGQEFDEVMHYEPGADAAAATPGSIRFEVERRGEVAGDHAVVLSSPTETLTLSHSVTTRLVFADGALRAAKWVLARPAGRYSMADVLSPDG